jgi:serine/threonine protein phosphatase 1
MVFERRPFFIKQVSSSLAMPTSLFHRIFTPKTEAKAVSLSCLSLPNDDRSIYVVGDLHGSAGLLRRIEAAIVADMNGTPAHFVLLGDLIDRGPDSADVLDHMLRRPPAGLTRHAILGNHEAMFLRFMDNPARAAEWLNFGGRETLASYGIDPHKFAALSAKQQRHQIDAHIPATHINFLADLPAVLTWGDVTFAHAGFDFAAPLTAQSKDTILWARAPTARETLPLGTVLVHGHFPMGQPDLTQPVINMDVGAYITNRASILHLDNAGNRRLIEL